MVGVGEGSAGNHGGDADRSAGVWTSREAVVAIVIALIVLAVIFGGIGLFVTAAKWALIIAAVLLIAGVVMGAISGRRTTT